MCEGVGGIKEGGKAVVYEMDNEVHDVGEVWVGGVGGCWDGACYSMCLVRAAMGRIRTWGAKREGASFKIWKERGDE
jgi:hypothetical protein